MLHSYIHLYADAKVLCSLWNDLLFSDYKITPLRRQITLSSFISGFYTNSLCNEGK